MLNVEKEKSPVGSTTRESMALKIDVEEAENFYQKYSQPVPNKVLNIIESIKNGAKNVEIDSNSTILVFNEQGKKKFKKLKSKEEMIKLIEQSERAVDRSIRLKEIAVQKMLNRLSKTKEDAFSADTENQSQSMSQGGPGLGVEEYTPLFSGYFYKQMYLYDYQLMNTKAFWFKNYSGIAKAIIDMTRSFVIGEGYSLTIKDKNAEKVWEEYEERTDIKNKIKVWCDEISTFGESFIKRVPTSAGIDHVSIEPSTVWEIVTDPENIKDVKFYWQMYPTQYQIISDGDTPTSKYVMNHIPPEQIIHKKINCTSFEKRGRSDLLAAMYYLKMFDKYVQAKLGRAISEMSYYWDVTIKGDATDVANYLASNSSITDVPPGSENVHNEALERKPMAPSLSPSSNDEVAKWIMSYIALSVNIPYSWFAMADSGGESKASAVVKTEPVVRKMTERRKIIESILKEIFKDVMIENGLDPDTHVEFNFPDMVVDDRSKKIADIITVTQAGYFSKKTSANMVAQQLDVTEYDYDLELSQIKKESTDEMVDYMSAKPPGSDLTPKDKTADNMTDREKMRDSGKRE